jgi:hypothetical protein
MSTDDPTGGRQPEAGSCILRTCTFIRASGVLCQSIALKESKFCYYHARQVQRRRVSHAVLNQRRYAHANEKSAHFMSAREAREFDDLSAQLFRSLDIPPVEDAASYQVALNALQDAVQTQQINDRRGALLLRIIRASKQNVDAFKMEHDWVNHERNRADSIPDEVRHPFEPELAIDANGEPTLRPNYRPAVDVVGPDLSPGLRAEHATTDSSVRPSDRDEPAPSPEIAVSFNSFG